MAITDVTALPPGFRWLEVLERRPLTKHIVALTLGSELGEASAFQAGAHLELLLPTRGGQEVRHYSLTSDPSGCEPWSVAVQLEPAGRGGSQWIHDHAHPRSKVAVRGPRDTFRYTPRRPTLFVAGGIGVTPIVPMVDRAEAAGIDWRMCYVGRSSSGMAFADRLATYDRAQIWDVSKLGRLSLASVIEEWRGRQPGTETTVVGCGPASLLTKLAEIVEHHPEIELVTESFLTGRPNAEAPPVKGVEDHDETFVVELEDGTEVEVSAGVSIIEALGSAGIRTLSSCQRGECGTCETPVISGEVDHRDSLLSDEERATNETMMICVSRAAKGCPRLVLQV